MRWLVFFCILLLILSYEWSLLIGFVVVCVGRSVVLIVFSRWRVVGVIVGLVIVLGF